MLVTIGSHRADGEMADGAGRSQTTPAYRPGPHARHIRDARARTKSRFRRGAAPAVGPNPDQGDQRRATLSSADEPTHRKRSRAPGTRGRLGHSASSNRPPSLARSIPYTCLGNEMAVELDRELLRRSDRSVVKHRPERIQTTRAKVPRPVRPERRSSAMVGTGADDGASPVTVRAHCRQQTFPTL